MTSMVPSTPSCTLHFRANELENYNVMPQATAIGEPDSKATSQLRLEFSSSSFKVCSELLSDPRRRCPTLDFATKTYSALYGQETC